MPRTIIATDPELVDDQYIFEGTPWKAQWIGPEEFDDAVPLVMAFRKKFTLPAAGSVRIHVTADERYQLFLDGQPIGRGPERGDLKNWFYESYDLPLTAGEHQIVARVWRLGQIAAYAQITSRPGFFLLAEGESSDQLTTGVATWEMKTLGGFSFTPMRLPGAFFAVSSASNIHADKFDWDATTGGGVGWTAAPVVAKAVLKKVFNESPMSRWTMRPAILPAMMSEPKFIGSVRSIEATDTLDVVNRPVEEKSQIKPEIAPWQSLLTDRKPLTIPANTGRRIIIDLDNYYCFYPRFRMSGGRGATVRMQSAESLFHSASSKPDVQGHSFRKKGNRNEIFGKSFIGIGCSFYADGSSARTFETLWWHAGRFVELVVLTKDQPLTIEQIEWTETHYPFKFEYRFESSDARLAEVIPIGLRTLEMCGHETYYDCPYYEQLMYIGDTRLEALVTHTTCRDDRLPRKAIELFDEARDASGLMFARTPTSTRQWIPPFCLWWIGMLHDYAMYRDDLSFVKARLPGARAVLDTFLKYRRDDSLLDSPPGWNFIDWVKEWPAGIPPTGYHGPGGPLNLKIVWILKQMAELETAVGEPELAARWRRSADELAAAIRKAFFDPGRGMFADDLAHSSFSEHAQCLSILGGTADAEQRLDVILGLLNANDLHRTTIYFTHYLFETFAAIDRPDKIIDRMGLWFDLNALGLKTTVEMGEPTRSDCHAWGAHPIFHYYASLLGIRPSSAGFNSVRIRPQLGPLGWAKGSMVHPKGTIEVDFRQTGGKVEGTVKLPPGVKGVLIMNGQETAI